MCKSNMCLLNCNKCCLACSARHTEWIYNEAPKTGEFILAQFLACWSDPRIVNWNSSLKVWETKNRDSNNCPMTSYRVQPIRWAKLNSEIKEEKIDVTKIADDKLDAMRFAFPNGDIYVCDAVGYLYKQ